MRLQTYRLICHPETPQGALSELGVVIGRRGACCLSLSFRAIGRVSEVAWPGDQVVGFENWQQADELWQHTCFEVFVRAEGETAYTELNFATSRKWAAYGFSNYRKDMSPVGELTLHSASWQIQKSRADLNAVLGLPPAYLGKNWELGISAVIEAADGSKSYWALVHPPGKPDFHHPDCFAAILPAPDAS